MKKAADAAREEAERLGIPAPLIIAVTILTSLSDEDMKAIGYAEEPAQMVKKLAGLKIEKAKPKAITLAGPIVGHVTEHSAAFWMYTPTSSKCTVSYSLATAG